MSTTIPAPEKMTREQAARYLPPEMLNREGAAAYIGVRPQTLAVWALTGRYSLPMHKIGRCVRYKRSDLDKWLESRRVGGEVTK